MKKFLLPGPCSGPTRLALGRADSRYLLRVLRLREGDTLPAADAQGGRYLMTICRAGREECEVDVVPAGATPAADAAKAGAPRITLLQCLPKGRKIDLIIRQATEAGVARIIPLVSAHSIVHRGEEGGRAARLLRIAREAVQQSGVPRMPLIEEPRDLSDVALRGGEWGTALVFVERSGTSDQLHRLLAQPRSEVSVLIGPEGGLADEEIALLERAGFRPVHLETGVLRVETAATFALGAVMTILQERNAWKPVQDE